MSNHSISSQAGGENHHLIIVAIAKELVAHGFNNHSFSNSQLLEKLCANLKINKSILLQYVNQPRINFISECAWPVQFDFDQMVLTPIKESGKSSLDRIVYFTQQTQHFFESCDSRILIFSAYFIEDFILGDRFVDAQRVYTYFNSVIANLLKDFLPAEVSNIISSAYVTVLFSAGFDGDKDQFLLCIKNANDFLIDVVTQALSKEVRGNEGLLATLKSQILKSSDPYGKRECIAIESFNRLSKPNQLVVDVIFFNVFGKTLSETVESLI